MIKGSREKYIKIIEEKIKDSKKRLERLSEDHNNSENAMTSRYDTSREEIEMAMDVQEKVIKELEIFLKFIKESKDCKKVEEGAIFSLTFDDNEEMSEVLYAPTTIALEKIQIITSKSPLGKVVFGKKRGDKFDFIVGEKQTFGIITSVE